MFPIAQRYVDRVLRGRIDAMFPQPHHGRTMAMLRHVHKQIDRRHLVAP